MSNAHSITYTLDELKEKQTAMAEALEKTTKPVHLIVGNNPNDVKLMCGDLDLAKETYISSISLELTPNKKKLVIEFYDFTAEIEATPTEINNPTGAPLPKWLPDSGSISLAS